MATLCSGDPAETDYTAVGCAITTISSNLTEMSKGVKLLAALMDDEGGNGQQLLGAAKNLAGAVSDMLKTAQPANTEVPSGHTQVLRSLRHLLTVECVAASAEPAAGRRKRGPGQRRVAVSHRRDRHRPAVPGDLGDPRPKVTIPGARAELCSAPRPRCAPDRVAVDRTC